MEINYEDAAISRISNPTILFHFRHLQKLNWNGNDEFWRSLYEAPTYELVLIYIGIVMDN
jgi:hypothetical protein